MSKLFEPYQPSDWYEPDEASCKKINDHAGEDLEIIAFHCRQCGDCTYTMPLFLKIMEKLDLNKIKITEVETDNSKKDKDGMYQKHNLAHIPTFILLKGGKEIHRVDMVPKDTIEKDLAGSL